MGIANAVSRPTPGPLVNSRVRSDLVCRRGYMQSGTNYVRVFAIQAHDGRNSRFSPGKVDKFQSSNLWSSSTGSILISTSINIYALLVQKKRTTHGVVARV
jgi:hypothetical protein